MTTTHDINSIKAVDEAVEHGIGIADFLKQLHTRMTNDMNAMPGMVVTLIGEINTLRIDNTRLANENNALKQRIESLKNR